MSSKLYRLSPQELQIFHKENLLHSELWHPNVAQHPVLCYLSLKKIYHPHPWDISERGVQRLGRAGIRRFRPRGGHQNNPFRGEDYTIPYTVGKLAPNSSHLTKGLVKYVPARGYYCVVPSQNGEEIVISPPPPNH